MHAVEHRLVYLCAGLSLKEKVSLLAGRDFWSATALAATWDHDTADATGDLLALEARCGGVDVVLGPTVNMQRTDQRPAP